MCQKKNIDLRVFHIKPLACIQCANWNTYWVPVYKGSVIAETILVCGQCGHNERIQQPAFKQMFKRWLEAKISGKDFQNGLANILNNKN